MLGETAHAGNKRRRVIPIATLAVIVLAACGGSNGQDRSQPTEPSISASPVVLGGASWPTWDRLKTMVESYDTVLVGKAGVPTLALRPLNPEALARGEIQVGPRDYAFLYPIQVSQVIPSRRAREGNTVTGVPERRRLIDGVSYEMEGDPLLQVGAVYLFFLDDLQPQLGVDEYSGPPGGRFVINDRGLVVPNGWESSPAVAALSAVPDSELAQVRYATDRDEKLAALARSTLAEATAKIVAALTEAGLPTVSPTATTTPSSVPINPTGLPTQSPRPTAPGTEAPVAIPDPTPTP